MFKTHRNLPKIVFIVFLLLMFDLSPLFALTDSVSGNPILKVVSKKTDIGRLEEGSVKDVSVSVRNAGKGELKWYVVTDTPWIGLGRNAKSVYQKGLAGGGASSSSSERRGKTNILPAGKTAKFNITVNSKELTAGKYEGAFTVKSNGGNEKINISVNVVSLQSIRLSPVLIDIREGDRRAFRVIGFWSDGSRTDLSSRSEGQWVVSDPSVGSFPSNRSVFVAEREGFTEIERIREDLTSNSAVVNVIEPVDRPVLLVSPREINLGSIGSGERSRGTYAIKNAGSGPLLWSTYGPDGCGNKNKLYGTDHLRVSVESLLKKDGVLPESGMHPVRIKLDTEKGSIYYKRKLETGAYSEMLEIVSDGETRHLFFGFAISGTGSKPRLEIEPARVDFGAVEEGKRLVEKIELKNGGKDKLKWRIFLQKNRKAFSGVALTKGRYVSFANKDVSGKNVYEMPLRLKDDANIYGDWSENGGYPCSAGKDCVLNYKFSGKGITVFAWKDVYGGTLRGLVDGRLAFEEDLSHEKREVVELRTAANLTDGPHVLTLVCGRGTVAIEGVRIDTDNRMVVRHEWLKVFPDTGTTTGEIDYINLTVDSRGLEPGLYSENVLFSSNGGNGIVEVSLEVKERTSGHLIDIYKYTKGDDCLLTSKTTSENPGLLRSYKNDGIVFKLFTKGTPGTTEFFGWYNFSKGNHFYSYDRNKHGRPLDGYVFEGAIGNIATIRLHDTKELYRWFNPYTKTYFYTTDLKEGVPFEKGYKYDGIAGYVR